jgi:glycerol kinase
MASVLAIDQGTTGSTALVVADDGRILARAYSEFTQHFPRPGWVEHDPEELWTVTLAVAQEAVREAGETPAAVGITNQRETVVAWDRATGRPLHRALVWQDRRTAERCRELQAELGDAYVAEHTGLVWDPYFSATKAEWLLANVPEVRAAAGAGTLALGTIDAWLVYRLTAGAHLATDHSNASRTLLYNLAARDWDADLLARFGVPRDALPAIVRSSEVVGETAASVVGFAAPIAGIAGDQQAALFGQGCWHPGDAKCTYGTGAFLLMMIGEELAEPPAPSGVLTTAACTANGDVGYALEGSIFIAGAAIQWLRDGLQLVEHASETEALARSIDDTGGVYFVPALVGLGAPHWESEARGTIVGLTRGTGRAHVVRAALESMAYGTREVLDRMHDVSGVDLTALKVDGGAAANDWLMQFQADALGVAVSRPDVVESTAMGAAGLAGLAAGVWSSAEDFQATRQYHSFAAEPVAPGGFLGWQRAVETALHWARQR